VDVTNRCPKCGKNNYGDVKKCSFCGAPLTFIPGEEVTEISEEDIQEKMSKMKVERIKNPLLMGIGGIVGIIGLVLIFVIYLSIMFLVYSPSGVEPSYDLGAWNYNVDGGEQMIFGEITAITSSEDTNWDTGGDHGYLDYTAYEISGDGDDNRVLAYREGNVNYESHVWVYSKEDLGDEGDMVLIRVESKYNDFGEQRAVSPGYAPWGGKGYLSGWIWILPGLLIFLGGLAAFLIGFIGRSDRSMERLMSEDKELRRQQLMLREAARKQMEEKEKQRQWQEGGGLPQAAGQTQAQTPVPEAVQQPVQQGGTPQAGYPSQPPSDMQPPQTEAPPTPQYQPPQ
jgi:hypothetical protein